MDLEKGQDQFIDLDLDLLISKLDKKFLPILNNPEVIAAVAA